MKGQMLYRTEGYKSARTSIQNEIEKWAALHSAVRFWQIIEEFVTTGTVIPGRILLPKKGLIRS